MKINWGTGIAIFYSLFMATMIYMVYQSTQHDRNLVIENYYEKDLQYQSHLDRIKNANALKSDLKIVQHKEENLVRFSFPKELVEVKGDILFYRPSDNKQDFKTKIQLDNNQEFIFPTTTLQKGGWKIKVDWEGDKTPFYKEVAIQI